MAKPLYCSFDPENYFPEEKILKWDLGYLGTYSDDRQPPLENLMLKPQKNIKMECLLLPDLNIPDSINWGKNVNRIDHLPPAA